MFNQSKMSKKSDTTFNIINRPRNRKKKESKSDTTFLTSLIDQEIEKKESISITTEQELNDYINSYKYSIEKDDKKSKVYLNRKTYELQQIHENKKYINDLNKEYEKILSCINEKEQYLEKNKYKVYLMNIINNTNEYSNINDLKNRYHLLNKTYNDLEEKSKQLIHEIMLKTKEYDELMDDFNN